MLEAVIVRGKNGKATIYNRKYAPRYDTPEQWQDVCQKLFGCDEGDVHTIAGVADPSKPHGGIWYQEDLASCEGMAFTLFQEPGHSRSDLADAKHWLKARRDVVAFYVLPIEWLPDNHPSIDEEQDDVLRSDGVPAGGHGADGPEGNVSGQQSD